MNTNQVVERLRKFGLMDSDKTVRKWALENNVSFMGEGRRKDYQWTEDDINRYLNRNKQRGHPKKE